MVGLMLAKMARKMPHPVTVGALSARGIREVLVGATLALRPSAGITSFGWIVGLGNGDGVQGIGVRRSDNRIVLN